MLTDEKFIRVISGELYMIKTIEWTVEIFPEIQILSKRLGFQGGIFFGGVDWLEMRLADQGSFVAFFI